MCVVINLPIWYVLGSLYVGGQDFNSKQDAACNYCIAFAFYIQVVGVTPVPQELQGNQEKLKRVDVVLLKWTAESFKNMVTYSFNFLWFCYITFVVLEIKFAGLKEQMRGMMTFLSFRNYLSLKTSLYIKAQTNIMMPSVIPIPCVYGIWLIDLVKYQFTH